MALPNGYQILEKGNWKNYPGKLAGSAQPGVETMVSL